MNFDKFMVAFIGNKLRGKGCGDGFDKSIASNQIHQNFHQILCYLVCRYIHRIMYVATSSYAVFYG